MLCGHMHYSHLQKHFHLISWLKDIRLNDEMPPATLPVSKLRYGMFFFYDALKHINNDFAGGFEI